MAFSMLPTGVLSTRFYSLGENLLDNTAVCNMCWPHEIKKSTITVDGLEIMTRLYNEKSTFVRKARTPEEIPNLLYHRFLDTANADFDLFSCAPLDSFCQRLCCPSCSEVYTHTWTHSGMAPL